MIENILIRKQTPAEGMYLYCMDANSNTYIISTCVYLGKDDTEWEECNEEQKAEFEAHNEQVRLEREKEMELNNGTSED